jgi:hypothetical protein
MSIKRTFALGTTAVLVTAAVAFAQGSGILFPDWSKPGKGTYEAPAGDLGRAVTQPWSTTTVASSIEGKPLPGKPVSVVGEIIDYSCYLQVGKHGDKHRDCGQKCLRNGQPIGLLAKDGTIYLLMEEEHDPRRDGMTDFRTAAIENMGYVMKVSGTGSEVNGQRAIYVRGYLKQ